MINIHNGDIILANNLKLFARMPKELFLEPNYHDLIKKDASHSSCIIYDLKPQILYDKLFDFGLYFENKKDLSFIEFNSTGWMPSWTDWSEELVRKNKNDNDNLLFNALGNPPYEYDWGEICSVYDNKSAVSFMIIRYF